MANQSELLLSERKTGDPRVRPLATWVARACIWILRRPDSEAAGLPVLLVNDEAQSIRTEPEVEELSIGRVVSRLRAFRKDPIAFKQDSGFAFAVNRLDRLSTDSS